MEEKSTAELFNELKSESDVGNFLAVNQKQLTKPFHEYLTKLLREKNSTVKKIAEELRLDRSYMHHIFSGRKKASRERVLAIARAMRLNLSETQYLLRYGGYAVLYPRRPWDSVIISAIEHDMTFDEMNDYLKNLGEEQIVSDF